MTVTHPEMVRYFMTDPRGRAARAAGRRMGAGRRDLRAGHGRAGADRGPGARPHPALRAFPENEVPIVYTGLRPGEKLFEELLAGDEEQTVQVRNRISMAKCPPPPADLAKRLSYLRQFADEGDRENLLVAIEELVPTYRRTPGQPAVPAAGLPRRPAPALEPLLDPDQEWAVRRAPQGLSPLASASLTLPPT